MTSATCDVIPLLRSYDVSYVEIQANVGIDVNTVWWQQQHLPIVATSGDIVVYNVSGLISS